MLRPALPRAIQEDGRGRRAHLHSPCRVYHGHRQGSLGSAPARSRSGNQVFVVAANQVGRNGEGLESYGRSMIVDPWGIVLAQVGDGEGIAVAELDLLNLEQVRANLPALNHQVL